MKTNVIFGNHSPVMVPKSLSAGTGPDKQKINQTLNNL